MDKAQTNIVVGHRTLDSGESSKITFIDAASFEKVKEVNFEHKVVDLAFNRRNDALLAVTNNGEVHILKFQPLLTIEK